MTRSNVPLGKIMGIAIGLDYSWFLIFAVDIIANTYVPGRLKKSSIKSKI